MPRYALVLALLLTSACKRGPAEEPAPPEEPPPPAEPFDESISAWSGGVVKGVVSRAEGTIDPPVGSKLMVMLWGGSLDVESKVLGQWDVDITGKAPWAFELSITEAEFHPELTYSVVATLNDAEGVVLFASKPQQIFRVGAAQGLVEITLDSMDARVNAK
ncbi:MAG: YbaY family lipoprotein [Nannocystaceae bacterium]